MQCAHGVRWLPGIETKHQRLIAAIPSSTITLPGHAACEMVLAEEPEREESADDDGRHAQRSASPLVDVAFFI